MNLKTKSFYKEAASSGAVPDNTGKEQEQPVTQEVSGQKQQDDAALRTKETH